jgi:hypothetical protein
MRGQIAEELTLEFWSYARGGRVDRDRLTVAQAVLAHQSLASVLGAGLPSFSQVQKHTRCSVGAVAGDKGCADQSQQCASSQARLGNGLRNQA